jgi:hypothetical protein
MNSTNDTMDTHELIRRTVDGTASADDFRTLQTRLLKDAEARRQYARYANLHGALGDGRLTMRPQVVQTVATSKIKSVFWFQWRHITAAAAGIVFGMFCTSVVFGYVTPLARSLTLLEESFEGASPLASKVVLEPGVWRGDQAVIVSAEQEVQPVSGQSMLRFLRQDHQGKARLAGGHIADVYRLIDLREHREDVAQGNVAVQASASVNANPFSQEERFGCAISLFALDADSVPESASYIGTALESEANAMARSSRTKLDREPASWQRLITEMLLPANTDYIVVRLHISQSFDSNGAPVFTGSYADDVRVSLTRRAPLP